MSGYIGSKTSVTQVDGYTQAEADAEFVQDPNGAITVSGSNVGIGNSNPDLPLTVTAASNANALSLRARSQDDYAFLQFYNHAGNTLRGQIWNHNGSIAFSTDSTGIERMRIDSSGNVGIGTSSPSAPIQAKKSTTGVETILDLTASIGNYNQGPAVDFSADWGSEYTLSRIHSINQGIGSGYAASLIFSTNGPSPETLAEAMRIDSSGKVMVGTTATVGGARFSVEHPTDCIGFNLGPSASGNRYLCYFRYNDVTVGSITSSGSSTSYNTSSDYRLKTDAQPMTGASARVQALNPVNFEWIADGTRVDGFLAHEAQEVVPECATGTKDAMRDEEYEVTPAVLDEDGNETTAAVMGTRSVPDYQGIDQSKLVPLLTAALQEALTKIDDMETRLAALEGN